jgi:hypothetical protein
MKAHEIENGIVVNTIEVQSLDFLPNLIVGDVGEIGWTYNQDGTLVAPIAEDPIKKEWENLRTERNRLLAETDYFALSDVTMSAEMTEYRKALRDLPANTDDLFNPVYPDKPK